jgi:hypothetical protein
MDADHQRTGRKISDLYRRKAGIGLSILKEIIITLESATQTEGEAGSKPG